MEDRINIYPIDCASTYEPVTIQQFGLPYIAVNPHEWLLGQIQQFESLKENWDGYEAEEIPSIVIENCQNFVRLLSGEILEKVSDIYPNGHGTITLEWINSSREKLALEVGIDKFSYFVDYNSKPPTLVDKRNLLSHIKEISSEITQLFAS